MQTKTRHIPFGTRVFVLLLCGLLTAWPVLDTGAAAGTPAPTPTPPALPPTQPATGPGGAEVAYDGLLAQHFGPQPDGTGEPTGYWLFEPTEPRTQGAAGPLPLVIILHGYSVVDPEIYHAWIDHLVRRGAIVVYPDYQNDFGSVAADVQRTDFPKTLTDAEAAVRAALLVLGTGGHARPDLGRVAVVGHSHGAILAAAYAAAAASQGLPVPGALLLAMPGCSLRQTPATVAACRVLGDLSTIPSTTRVLVLAGGDDTLAGTDPQWVWAQLTAVRADHKDFVTLVGDAHGQPPLVADHFVAWTTSAVFLGHAVGTLNALDWYGTWKFLDALMGCSFAGQDCQDALGNTPQQRFMGTWSDGVPVTEAIVTENPGTPTP
jgi:acetyl esterase/lipase